MEPIEGEPSWGDGLPGPAPLKHQGKKKQKKQGPVAGGQKLPPHPGPLPQGRRGSDGGSVMAQNKEIRRFLQALAAAIMLFLSGNLSVAEIFHSFIDNADGSHKKPPVQNTTRREDRGDKKVEIQQEENENGGSATGNDPTNDGPPLVPCEAIGVGCLNRVPSGFCNFRKHFCIVAPQSDFLISLDSKIDQLLREFHPQVAGQAAKLPDTKWIHQGRLHFEVGCKQLYVGGEYFNLENNDRARWCMFFMTEGGAFSPEKACHFRDEIDVFVRGKTSFAASPNVRIHEYFRDAGGRLDYLHQLLFRSDWGSGKYYLLT